MGTIDFSTQKERVRPITMSIHIMKTPKIRERSLPLRRSQWKLPEKPQRFLRSDLDWAGLGKFLVPPGHGLRARGYGHCGTVIGHCVLVIPSLGKMK